LTGSDLLSANDRGPLATLTKLITDKIKHMIRRSAFRAVGQVQHDTMTFVSLMSNHCRNKSDRPGRHTVTFYQSLFVQS